MGRGELPTIMVDVVKADKIGVTEGEPPAGELRNSNTRRALEGSGIELPRVIDYLERLFRYCQESDWGKKTILAA